MPRHGYRVTVQGCRGTGAMKFFNPTHFFSFTHQGSSERSNQFDFSGVKGRKKNSIMPGLKVYHSDCYE